MSHSSISKATLYLIAAAILWLPLRGAAFFDSGVADTPTGNIPCHTLAAAMYLVPDIRKDSTHDCCDTPELPHDCAHCLVSMAIFNEMVAPLKRAIYRQPQTSYRSIKSIPHEGLFRPPRLS